MARARRQGWPVYATYGLTEGCSQVATERPPGAAASGVGPPVPGVEVRIVPLPVVEAEPGGEPLRRYESSRGAGAVGRIQIRGPILFEGYLGADPGAPLERPFRPGGWFDTGDLGSLDRDGCLMVVGRRSDRILTGGENVDPTEVEAAVTSWPGAAAACVVGLPDDEWGEVVAAVVGRGARFAAGGGFPALERHLRGCLAGYKRPRRWRAVDALPTAPSGKVDRQACTALFAGRSAATAPGDGLQEPVE